MTRDQSGDAGAHDDSRDRAGRDMPYLFWLLLLITIVFTSWMILAAEAAAGGGPPVTIERAEPVLYEPEVVG